jgi:hypothetical protein
MGDWPARFLVFAENVDDVGVGGFCDDRNGSGDRGNGEQGGFARDSAPLKAAGGACNGEGETVGRQGGDEGGDRFVICRGPCCRGGASGVDRDEQRRGGQGFDELVEGEVLQAQFVGNAAEGRPAGRVLYVDRDFEVAQDETRSQNGLDALFLRLER